LNGTTTHYPSVDAQGPAAARAGLRHALTRQSLSHRAFTLMEIIIVVVVIGLLATVVLPQFSSDNKQAHQIALKDDLQYLRTQIAVFRAQHQDVSPGYREGYTTFGPNLRCFVEQMTEYSDINCNLSQNDSPVYPYGPYLKQLPVNPINNSSDLILVPNNQAMPAPGGSAGWIYKAQTQEIVANLAGNDDKGIPYSTY